MTYFFIYKKSLFFFIFLFILPFNSYSQDEITHNWKLSIYGKEDNIITIINSTFDGEDIYIAGKYLGEGVLFGKNDLLSTSLKEDRFYSKITNEGKFDWVKSEFRDGIKFKDSKFNDNYGRKRYDNIGDYYITQPISKKGRGVGIYGSKDRDYQIIKYNSNDKQVWSRNIIGHEKSETFLSSACDNNSLLVAFYTESIEIKLNDEMTIKNVRRYKGNSILIKYSENGDIVWGTFIGDGKFSRKVRKIIPSQNGEIYIVCEGSEIFKLAADGETIWKSHIKGIGTDIIGGIININGELFVSGLFSSHFWPYGWFEKNKISPQAVGDSDTYIARLDDNNGDILNFYQIVDAERGGTKIFLQKNGITIVLSNKNRIDFYNFNLTELDYNLQFKKYTFN